MQLCRRSVGVPSAFGEVKNEGMPAFKNQHDSLLPSNYSIACAIIASTA